MVDHVHAVTTHHDLYVAHQWIVHLVVGAANQLCKCPVCVRPSDPRTYLLLISSMRLSLQPVFVLLIR